MPKISKNAQTAKTTSPPTQRQTPNKAISYCTKCDIAYSEEVNVCACCHNKAYLKTIEVKNKSIVVTPENKHILEKHCKTVFPNDVIAVIPTAVCGRVGLLDLIEEEKVRQVVREKARTNRERRAEEKANSVTRKP